MLWIYLTVAGNLAVAVAMVIDKYLLAAKPMRPLAYTFGIALLSIVAVTLIPFGVQAPSSAYSLPIVGAGIANFLGLLFFFRAVRQSDVSLAAAKAGTFVVVSTYGFSRLFGVLSDIPLEVSAIVLLAAGMFLLGMLGRSIFVWTLFAGISFGFSFTMFKITLDGLGFVDGVFWTRMAFVATALVVFLVPSWGRIIIQSWRRAPGHTRKGLIISKILAGAGLLTIYYAIELGDVVTVTALEGVRFAFVLVFALILQKWLPHDGERSTPHLLLGKIVGIALIMAGFFALII